jgi:Putative Ig domain
MRRTYLIPSRSIQPLTIVQSSPLPNATQGSAYSFQFTAAGGVPPYTWSMPATNGLTINASTGLLSGVPLGAETDNLSVTVTDASVSHVTGIFTVQVVPAGALDLYPGGLIVADPYASYNTWFVDAVSGVDPTPGSHQAVGYTYQTYDAALLDVFYAAGLGARRIVVKATGPYTPGGTLTNNRGSYFPFGGVAGTPYVIQGDPANTTFPIIDDQLGGCSVITGVSLGATTTFTVKDPLSGPSRQPFVIGETLRWANIGDVGEGAITNITQAGTCIVTLPNTLAVNDTVQCYGVNGMTQINGLQTLVLAASPSQVTLNLDTRAFSPYTSGGSIAKISGSGSTLNGNSAVVTATGGSAGAWQVTVAFNSTGFNAFVFGGNIYRANTNMFGIGNSGGFGTTARDVNHIVIRKMEMANSISGCVYINGFGSFFPTDITIEYCSMHGNRYPYTNPGGTGGLAAELHGTGVTFLTLRYSKLYDMSLRPDVNLWHGNCVSLETYGSDNVTIQNCLLVNQYGALRCKTYQQTGVPSGDATQNNWTVTNNIFSGCYYGLGIGTTGFTNFKPANNWVITGNLIYGPPLQVTGGISCSFISLAGAAEPTLPTGNNILIANNTFAEDCANGIIWFAATNVSVRDNVSIVNASGLDTTLRHVLTASGTGSTFYTAKDNVVFSQFDYNVYGNASVWQLDNLHTPSTVLYNYSSFAAWKTAFTVPVGPGAPTPPPDLAITGNPDQNGHWIPDLTAPYNTVAGNFPNAGSRDYTIAPGSPLLTASSTAGRVGYDPANCGPGW